MNTLNNDLILRDSYNPYKHTKLGNYSSVLQSVPASRVSDKYSFIPTTRAMGVLANAGWTPTQVIETKTRKADLKGFQKHMVRFSHEQFKGNEENIEILLVNSHSGLCSFKLMLGVFRMVCSNGLISGDTSLNYSIRHKGYTDEAVYSALTSITSQAPKVIEKTSQYKNIKLSEHEENIYTDAVIDMVYDEEDRQYVNKRTVTAPKRYADTGNDLWTVFNRAQENLLRGGIQTRKPKAGSKYRTRRNTSRQVKNVDKNIKLNQALWTLTEKMAELKLAA